MFPAEVYEEWLLILCPEQTFRLEKWLQLNTEFNICLGEEL
jgi:hypothetical protein